MIWYQYEYVWMNACMPACRCFACLFQWVGNDGSVIRKSASASLLLLVDSEPSLCVSEAPLLGRASWADGGHARRYEHRSGSRLWCLCMDVMVPMSTHRQEADERCWGEGRTCWRLSVERLGLRCQVVDSDATAAVSHGPCCMVIPAFMGICCSTHQHRHPSQVADPNSCPRCSCRWTPKSIVCV